MVRLWIEPLGNQQSEVRMQIKHVLSGETRYCRTWTELVEFLRAKLVSGEEGTTPNPGLP
jgi:hypothetical protein